MLKIESDLSDVVGLLARLGKGLPLRVEGGRILAKKLGVEVAVGPARCDAASGKVVLPVEVVDAFGGALGRRAARAAVFQAVKRRGVPEAEIDSENSTITIDGRKLLSRIAPAFSDYVLVELTFVAQSGEDPPRIRVVAGPSGS